MTKKDATQILMGFILGATLNKKLESRYDSEGLLIRKVTKKGVELLMSKQDGFFNALERVVREELENSGFDGEMH